MYVVIWRYRVDPAQEAKFAKAYGPKGEWAKFFSSSKDYLGTELLADDERLGEYVTMVTLGALVAVFFLGGWRGPFLPPLLWFLIKVAAVAFVIIWIRGTLSRLRYDQLMHLGWKLLVPVALINIIVTGGIMLALGYKV